MTSLSEIELVMLHRLVSDYYIQDEWWYLTNDFVKNFDEASQNIADKLEVEAKSRGILLFNRKNHDNEEEK